MPAAIQGCADLFWEDILPEDEKRSAPPAAVRAYIDDANRMAHDSLVHVVMELSARHLHK